MNIFKILLISAFIVTGLTKVIESIVRYRYPNRAYSVYTVESTYAFFLISGILAWGMVQMNKPQHMSKLIDNNTREIQDATKAALLE